MASRFLLAVGRMFSALVILAGLTLAPMGCGDEKPTASGTTELPAEIKNVNQGQVNTMKTGKPDKAEKADKVEKTDKTDKADKTDKTEKK